MRRWLKRGFPATAVLAFAAWSMPALSVGAEAAAPADATPGTPSPAVDSPPYCPPEDANALLRVTPEMRRFFAGWMIGPPNSEDRLRQLIEAIILPKGLAFVYDGEGAFDPQTTFRLRRGNCVSFAMLVVAVARDLGFEASFQNVEGPTHWDRFGAIVASVQHVNVRVETYDGSFVADLRPDLVPHPEAYDVHLVRDEHAFADFYGDIGFFRLVHGRPAEALHYMLLATQTDPRSPSAWSNAGMLYARLGDVSNARSCFERALRLDKRSITALVGYVDILKGSGSAADLQLAKTLERRARDIREQNPYYHEHLADLAQADGDWAAAEKHLRRALRLKDDDPELYDGLGEVLGKLGRDKDAERATAKAKKLRTRHSSAAVYLEP